MLKTKLSHLQAVVEHEKLVNRVNAIAIIKKPTENTMKAGSYYNRSSVDNCDRGCRHDDSGTGGAVGNKCKQNDSKSGLDRDGFVDNKCGQDDRKPETDCIRHDTLKNECEQDDCKALVGCNQDDTKPELKEDKLKTAPIKDRLTKVDDTLYNDCKQDDIKPMINCDRDASVDNECKKDDCKPKMDYNEDENECEQDEGKPDLDCLELLPDMCVDGVGKECKQDDHDLLGDFSNATLTWSPSGWYMKFTQSHPNTNFGYCVF